MLGDIQPDDVSLARPWSRRLAHPDIPDAVAAALGDPAVLHRLQNGAAAMLRAWHQSLPAGQRLAEAEEIVQEAAQRALARRSAYDPERSVVPWLMGFVTLVCRERTRSRATDAATSPDGFALEDLMAKLARPADEATADRLDSRQLLERLPPGDQDLLRLRFFDDASALEIGRRLGISEAAVRVRLFRVLKRLRNELAAKREGQS